MNIVDGLIVLIVALYMLRGWSRGFVVVFTDLAGLAVAFLLALRWYPQASQQIEAWTGLGSGLGHALAFLLVFLIVSLAYAIITGLMYRVIPPVVHDSVVNRALGLFPAALNGLLISALLLTILVAVPIVTPLSQDIEQSRLGPPLLDKAISAENWLRPVFGDAISETLNFLTVKPESNESLDLPFKVANPQPDPAAEEMMLQLVNQARQENGLPALEMDEPLREVARAHSLDMFPRGYFAHNTPEGLSPFDRMQQAGIRYLAAGENLALARTVQLAFRGLMNSPGHRANILNPSFRRVGMGVMNGGIYGLMVSQEFTN